MGVINLSRVRVPRGCFRSRRPGKAADRAALHEHHVADLPREALAPPQQVTVRSGDQVITTFPADSKAPKLVTIPIAAAQFGNGDMAELTLDVDQTFAPGAGDVRELGIRVFHAFIEPK